jgi:recombination associated protein RdgC
MNHIKSAITYRATLPDINTLGALLAENQFSELTSLQFSGAGFIENPYDEWCVTVINSYAGDTAFTLRYDEKILPAEVFIAEARKAVEKEEFDLGERLSKKEIARIKEEVFNGMLAVALIKTTEITCFYRPTESLLIVPTSSKKLADIVTGKLLKSIGSIKATSIFVTDAKQGLTTKIENYLNGTYGFDNFEVGGSVKLKGGTKTESNEISVSFKTKDIFESKTGIFEAIASGAKVTEISLSNDDVEFNVNDSLITKGVSFIGDELMDVFDCALDEWKHTAASQVLMFANAHNHLCELFEYKEPVEAE